MTLRDKIQHHLSAAGYGIGLAPLPKALRATHVTPLELSAALGLAWQPVPVPARSARNRSFADFAPSHGGLTAASLRRPN